MFSKPKPNRTIAVASACLVAFLFCFVGSLPALAAEEWVCSSNTESAETSKSSATKFEVGLQTPFTDVPEMICNTPGKLPCLNFKSAKGSVSCTVTKKDDVEITKCRGQANEKFLCGSKIPGNTDENICKLGVHEYRFNPDSGAFQEIIRGETGTDIIMVYSKYLYTFLSATIGVISVLMLVVGGIQISIAGASQEGLTQGKERITSALVGLMLLFLSSLVLYTINPNFYSLESGPGKSAAPSNSNAGAWVCEE